ncbi:MAG: type II toxin-antitoxin system RelE/ParE family toxin [Ignavibacteriae bacterium]|nr:type II toxin-antitoxin system RelE/ParE family toxin [Ignavibacteriota bacterium]
MKKLEYSETARKFLIKSDKNLSKRLLGKIDLLLTSPDKLQIKKLKVKEGIYRIRVGDYRILFEFI